MTHKENQSVTKKAVEYAKAHHVLVSFDPNIREPLWESMDLLRQQMAYGMSRCDILKISILF